MCKNDNKNNAKTLIWSLIISIISCLICIAVGISLICKNALSDTAVYDGAGTFLSIVAAFIGACATIMVGAQISNHVKVSDINVAMQNIKDEIKDIRDKHSEIKTMHEEVTSTQTKLEDKYKSFLDSLEHQCKHYLEELKTQYDGINIQLTERGSELFKDLEIVSTNRGEKTSNEDLISCINRLWDLLAKIPGTDIPIAIEAAIWQLFLSNSRAIDIDKMMRRIKGLIDRCTNAELKNIETKILTFIDKCGDSKDKEKSPTPKDPIIKQKLQELLNYCKERKETPTQDANSSSSTPNDGE